MVVARANTPELGFSDPQKMIIYYVETIYIDAQDPMVEQRRRSDFSRISLGAVLSAKDLAAPPSHSPRQGQN